MSHADEYVGTAIFVAFLLVVLFSILVSSAALVLLCIVLAPLLGVLGFGAYLYTALHRLHARIEQEAFESFED